MTKRYGRNQKRRDKAKIAELERARAVRVRDVKIRRGENPRYDEEVRLRHALRRYGQHLEHCDYPEGAGPCSCGFAHAHHPGGVYPNRE